MLKELNLQEMNEIKGGISRVEYCEIIFSMFTLENLERWTPEQFNAFLAAYDTHCTWKLEQGVGP